KDITSAWNTPTSAARRSWWRTDVGYLETVDGSRSRYCAISSTFQSSRAATLAASKRPSPSRTSSSRRRDWGITSCEAMSISCEMSAECQVYITCDQYLQLDSRGLRPGPANSDRPA